MVLGLVLCSWPHPGPLWADDSDSMQVLNATGAGTALNATGAAAATAIAFDGDALNHSTCGDGGG